MLAVSSMVQPWREQEPLAPRTTFGIGGSAAYLVEVTSEDELINAVREAHRVDVPVTVLGGGSNVLIADEGVPGLTIVNRIGGIAHEVVDGMAQVTAGAGVVWDELVARTVEHGWWGLENLSAIPGTVGATPIQNVGAYGVEVAERMVAVRAFHRVTGEWRTFSAAECSFGYRHSFFKTDEGAPWIVTAVTFALTTVPTPVLGYRDLATRFGDDTTPSQAAIREAVMAIRSAKFPDWHELGTAGSFFKNPTIDATAFALLKERYPELPSYAQPNGMVKIPLGWVLDKVCNLRGYRDGAVGCYEAQALVVVNYGGATAALVRDFAAHVAMHVHEATGITIEWEVTTVPAMHA